MIDELAGLLTSELAPAYALGLYAGLRAGEVRALQWSDITADMRWLELWGKNKRQDVLPISSTLRGYLGERGEGAVTWLPVRAAEAVKRDSVSDDIDFHCLRHTFGTWLAENETAIHEHRCLMRHSTLELTMKYYVHLRLGASQEAVELLGKAPTSGSKLA